ncbi:hypothetical protein HF086_008429 [Spodoptera exigua]|uniref:CCHC-type domain-containing protein n=1 Tax=Spodoptera exigua TaxID=7107 RepID=A0A922MPA0_SPOEX|nr:hypothetical protein HF086_008429 [Spodoptera exigua]
METNKQRYKELITKRVSAKGQITKFKNYLNNISKEDELSSIQLTELNLKLAKFEALSVRVDELQNDIEVLNPDNIAAEIDERDNIERDIIINMATAKNLLEMFSRKNESEQRRNSWEEHRNSISSESPSLDQFCKFIINRANVLESTNRNSNNTDNSTPSKTHERGSNNSQQNPNQRRAQNNIVKSFASTNNINNNKHKVPKGFSCIVCDDSHRIYDCPTFKSKNIDERMSDVTRYKLCLNCLRQGHAVKDCRFRSCLEPDCNERHNTLLHRPASSAKQIATVQEPVEVVTNFCNKNTSQILLSTAMVVISNPFDHQRVKVRALLDCGSQSSFITESLKTRLKLSSHPIDTLKVIGIGNTLANNVTESCNIVLQSLHNKFKITCSCLVLKELTGRLPKTPIDTGLLQLPKDVQLADPMFHQPADIDVLIGADLFWDILGNKQITLGVNEPKLRSSQLSWIVSGPIQSSVQRKVVHCNHSSVCRYTNSEDNIGKMLTKFWDLEDIPTRASMNKNECESHFLTHTTRTSTGRFCVKLPLKDTADCLGDSYKLAKRRFIKTENRLKRNRTLKLEYTKFINEYEKLGHLTVLKNDYFNKNTIPSYYLCHHAVLKQESESTKLRVVFDGSAPTTSGCSLNDILMVGPTVQDTLFSILLRSRQYKYLLTGDIEKMYRQRVVKYAGIGLDPFY